MTASRIFLSILGAIVVFSAVAFGLYWASTDPRSPLPREWNPIEPLVISDPMTPLTGFKLERALSDPELCLATLEQAAEYSRMEPLDESAVCGIANRVELRSVAGYNLRPIETSCETALRLTLWAEHGLKSALNEILLSDATSIRHIGSYNCRPIRGSTTQMSTHAAAASIDIAGVTLSNGRYLPLLGNWDGEELDARFNRALRDHGCDWFQTVLGPEYNALHAGHFHFQSRGWGTCR